MSRRFGRHKQARPSPLPLQCASLPMALFRVWSTQMFSRSKMHNCRTKGKQIWESEWGCVSNRQKFDLKIELKNNIFLFCCVTLCVWVWLIQPLQIREPSQAHIWQSFFTARASTKKWFQKKQLVCVVACLLPYHFYACWCIHDTGTFHLYGIEVALFIQC